MAQEIELESLDLAALIRPGDHVVVGNGGGEPLTLVEQLAAQRHEIGHANVFIGGGCFSGILLPEHADALRFTSYGAFAHGRRLAKAGVLRIIPLRISNLPSMFRDGGIGADVVMLHLTIDRATGDYSFGLTNDYLQAAMARARVVIAEVNDRLPWTYYHGRLDPKRIDYVVHTSRAPLQFQPAKIGATEAAIGRHVTGFISNGVTLQIGMGDIPEAVLAGLADRRDLGIHSGVIGDRVADLMERGVITNARKPVDTGLTTCASVRGTNRIYDFVDRNRAIRLFPLDHTHGMEVLSRLDRIVAVNSAVEVDLTGQVNAETAAGVYVGGVGGQADFVRGVQMAARGRSIIALPATAREGRISRIVARLSGSVTTPRCDADLVVTEFGVAELRGQPLDERVRRMIAISHPDFRESLEREARTLE